MSFVINCSTAGPPCIISCSVTVTNAPYRVGVRFRAPTADAALATFAPSAAEAMVAAAVTIGTLTLDVSPLRTRPPIDSNKVGAANAATPAVTLVPTKPGELVKPEPAPNSPASPNVRMALAGMES